MKQLYSTGTLKSNPLHTLNSLRASTLGVGADELNAALNFAHYALPPARTNETDRPVWADSSAAQITSRLR